MTVTVAAVLMFGLAAAVIRALSNWFSLTLAVSMQSEVQVSFLEHLIGLSFDFHDKRRPGEVLARLGDARRTLEGTLQVLYETITGVAMLLIFPPVLFYLSWRLSLIAMAALPLVIAWVLVMNRRIADATSEIAGLGADMNATEHEMLNGVRTVKSLGAETWVVTHARDLAARLRAANVRRGRYQFMGSLGSAGLMLIGTFVYSYVGWHAILDGRVTLGSFLAFTGLVGYLKAPAMSAVSVVQRLQTTLIHTDRFFDVYDLVPTVPEPTRPARPTEVRGRVESQGIVFGYEKGSPVLRDVSFSIAPGQVAAITGESGSGKTTILNLIARFYEPESGRILIDGIDIADFSKDFLRNAVGLMRQEPFLFNASIRDNIACGSDRYRDVDVERAARAARAAEFIDHLPRRYETLVGERGDTLSVGQKQRICLSRLLLRAYPVMLLDEPSAAWSEADEVQFLKVVKESCPRSTIVIATHRTAVTALANVVLELRDGMINVVSPRGSATRVVSASSFHRESRSN
jgi:ABC-type bacteriocin/lantibiotic exporter with double-glycine peptidase domain